ncbi:transposase [Bradyrhizobium sp. 159]|nr:transposase [Bradyrhizobium sp. 159]
MRYGQRSERSSRLIEQLALTFEELEVTPRRRAGGRRAVAKSTTVRYAQARRTSDVPEHLPRERVVIDPPTGCECCGGNRAVSVLLLAGTGIVG